MNVRTPLLFLASQAQQYKCAMVLLTAKADPNATFNSPMSAAAQPPLVACFDSQRKLNMPAALDIAAALIAAKADPNSAGRTPDGCTELMIDCECGDAVVVAEPSGALGQRARRGQLGGGPNAQRAVHAARREAAARVREAQDVVRAHVRSVLEQRRLALRTP